MQKYTTYFLPSNEYRSSYNNYETEMIFEIKTVTLYHGDSYRHENRSFFKVDTEKLTTIDLFTDTAAILIRFKEYYGMPRGHSLRIYARSLGKKGTSEYISQEKGDHYDIQTRPNDLFSH